MVFPLHHKHNQNHTGAYTTIYSMLCLKLENERTEIRDEFYFGFSTRQDLVDETCVLL